MIRLVGDKVCSADLKSSVKNNIDTILNTRNTLSVAEFLSLPGYSLSLSN